MFKKSQNFDFSKKWGKINDTFEILVPKNIMYHDEIQNFPKSLGNDKRGKKIMR